MADNNNKVIEDLTDSHPSKPSIEFTIKELSDKIDMATSFNQKLSIQIKTYINQIIAPLQESVMNGNGQGHKVNLPELFQFINDDHEEIDEIKRRMDKLHLMIERITGDVYSSQQCFHFNDNVEENSENQLPHKPNDSAGMTRNFFKNKSSIDFQSKESNEGGMFSDRSINFFHQRLNHLPVQTYYSNRNISKFKEKKKFEKLLFNNTTHNYSIRNSIDHNAKTNSCLYSNASLFPMDNNRGYYNDPYFHFLLKRKVCQSKASKIKSGLHLIESDRFSLHPQGNSGEINCTSGQSMPTEAFALLLKEAHEKIGRAERTMREMNARMQSQIDEIRQQLLDFFLKQSEDKTTVIIPRPMSIGNSHHTSSAKKAFTFSKSFPLRAEDNEINSILFKAKHSFLYNNKNTHKRVFMAKKNAILIKEDKKDEKRKEKKKIRYFSVSKVLTSKPSTTPCEKEQRRPLINIKQ